MPKYTIQDIVKLKDSYMCTVLARSKQCTAEMSH